MKILAYIWLLIIVHSFYSRVSPRYWVYHQYCYNFIFNFLINKGQTKSTLFFLANISSKNELDFTTMIPQVNLFLFVFQKKSKTPKNCFEMNSFQLSQKVSLSLINPSGWCGQWIYTSIVKNKNHKNQSLKLVDQLHATENNCFNHVISVKLSHS